MEIVVNVYGPVSMAHSSGFEQRVEESLQELHRKVEAMDSRITTLIKDFNDETDRIAALQEAEVAELKKLRDEVANAGDAKVAAALDEVLAGMSPIAARLRLIGSDATAPIPPVDNPPVPTT